MSKLRIQKRHRPVIDLIKSYGVKPEIKYTGTGHIKLCWNAGSMPQSVVIAVSPSDHHAHGNTAARIRKLMREAGLQPRP